MTYHIEAKRKKCCGSRHPTDPTVGSDKGSYIQVDSIFNLGTPSYSCCHEKRQEPFILIMFKDAGSSVSHIREA